MLKAGVGLNGADKRIQLVVVLRNTDATRVCDHLHRLYGRTGGDTALVSYRYAGLFSVIRRLQLSCPRRTAKVTGTTVGMPPFKGTRETLPLNVPEGKAPGETFTCTSAGVVADPAGTLSHPDELATIRNGTAPDPPGPALTEIV